ncbi:hypothetical protein GCM10010215_27570 [Streptomyces virginiae]|uniref:Uncharacterized protein n=1 Tax=Streptomyces virginiae TaxID=1961 RepID=A0ABQ3NXZ1_STRVG|nr:hypothetical protein GCM10010215_27570 [Streptomyces virginiae]GHI17640.1 hypothetical protein Scinn_71030 [Streptomyces virginiae]
MDVAIRTTSPSISTIRKGGSPGCTPRTVTRGEDMYGLMLSVMRRSFHADRRVPPIGGASAVRNDTPRPLSVPSCKIDP